MGTKPRLILIAGCNGAGKTTVARVYLPDKVHIKEFVNADEIARGISPYNMEAVAQQAGRIQIDRIAALLAKSESFAVETTLSSKGMVRWAKEAKTLGYVVEVIFVYLNSVALAKERVRLRVVLGGHAIPADVIERRYYRGIANFMNTIRHLADEYSLTNNSQIPNALIANKKGGNEFVFNNIEFTFLLKMH